MYRSLGHKKVVGEEEWLTESMACTKEVKAVRKRFEEWFNLSFAESIHIYRSKKKFIYIDLHIIIPITKDRD